MLAVEGTYRTTSKAEHSPEDLAYVIQEVGCKLILLSRRLKAALEAQQAR